MDVDHRLRAPVELARFWALALGYVEREPPGDLTSWEDWFRAHEIPEAEWDDGAGLSDPDGVLPRLTFLKVPEGKNAKPDALRPPGRQRPGRGAPGIADSIVDGAAS
ncbi:MAG TPA: hypothetical protein VGJ45_24505 [Pseudonocardiaceae bacterium]